MPATLPLQVRPLVDEQALAPPPAPRGPLSAALIGHLHHPDEVALPATVADRELFDADLQVTLHIVNTLQCRSYAGVTPAVTETVEWTALHRALLDWFETAVRARTGPGDLDVPIETYVDHVLARPSVRLDEALAERPERIREVFVAKAPYLLHEADAHTLALARLEPRVQHPMAEIQAGEYGVGHRSTHAEVYRTCLSHLGISEAAALDAADAPALAAANLTFLFASCHRLRGAAVGQLALFELDSVGPAERAKAAWDRAGLPEAARRWYDLHALADVEHARVVRGSLLPAVAAIGGDLATGFRFGVEATALLGEAVSAAHLRRWATPA